jgi:16S rRNA (cytosine967-C5)-methyltransferase
VIRPAAPSVSPARAAAFAVVRRVFEQGAYADRALRSEAAGLQARDRALATAIAYGTVQRCATLDYVLERLAGRPPSSLDAPILAAARLGLLQLLFMDGIAEHAAVNESVELAKRSNRGGAGLVNAVLRRAAREGRAILAELDDATPESAAILRSVPAWLAQLWFSELGADGARALLECINEPAEAAIRANTLVARPGDVLTGLPLAAHAAAGLPEGIVLDAPFDVHGSELFERGAIMPQSRGSMFVSRVLGPQPGERVLDLCAAPGAKTTHIAALMDDRGEVVAVERHAGRAAALSRTCRRMGAEIVRVEVGDAAAFATDSQFDRVLVDPPCSGLGTLQSRPDLRWRTNPDSIAELAELQARILRAAAAALRPGGVLVYSVCTISRAESGDVVERFLAEHQDFALDGQPDQLRPDRDGTDGFFIARLSRTR